MATKKQTTAAKRNIKKAQGAARKQRTIANSAQEHAGRPRPPSGSRACARRQGGTCPRGPQSHAALRRGEEAEHPGPLPDGQVGTDRRDPRRSLRSTPSGFSRPGHTAWRSRFGGLGIGCVGCVARASSTRCARITAISTTATIKVTTTAASARPPARQSHAGEVIERPATGAGQGQHQRDGTEDQVELEPALRVPQAVLAVNRDDGAGHHHHHGDRAERRQQAERERHPAAELGSAAERRGDPTRREATSVEHRRRPGKTCAAEPPEQLLQAVCHEEQPDDDPDEQESCGHRTHRRQKIGP